MVPGDPKGRLTCTHRRVLWVITSTGHFFPVLPQPAGLRSIRELAYALEATWRQPQATTHCAEAPNCRPTNPLSYALLASARCCGTAHLVLILSLLQPFILGLRQVSLVHGGRSICVSLLLPHGLILCSIRWTLSWETHGKPLLGGPVLWFSKHAQVCLNPGWTKFRFRLRPHYSFKWTHMGK